MREHPMIANVYTKKPLTSGNILVMDLLISEKMKNNDKIVCPEIIKSSNQSITILARCVRIVCQDSKTIGLTDHDTDLTIDEITYKSAAGYKPTAIHAGINRGEIEKDLCDHATCRDKFHNVINF